MSDPHPDSSPAEPEDDDRNDNGPRPEPEGEPGAVGGTDGVTKNQGDAQ